MRRRRHNRTVSAPKLVATESLAWIDGKALRFLPEPLHSGALPIRCSDRFRLSIALELNVISDAAPIVARGPIKRLNRDAVVVVGLGQDQERSLRAIPLTEPEIERVGRDIRIACGRAVARTSRWPFRSGFASIVAAGQQRGCNDEDCAAVRSHLGGLHGAPPS